MEEQPKKISFGFAKINKKPVVQTQNKKEEQVQYIDCLEGKEIKLVNGEEKGTAPPVIPLKNANSLRDNMIEVLKARKEKKKADVENKPVSDVEENKPLTLDELAAKEIIEDLKKANEAEEEVKEVHAIPQADINFGGKESALDDYESMPVNQFGLAVLRGMGWTPESGIGKNAQIVKPVNPVVRPKGMGLGADKVIQPPKTSNSKEELVMKKNASLKIFTGPYKGMYGKVEGFDELPGRIMVRLALQNSVISISENIIELVTTDEYNKNSKILNLSDYNNYHEKNNTNTAAEKSELERKKIEGLKERKVYERETVIKKEKQIKGYESSSEEDTRRNRHEHRNKYSEDSYKSKYKEKKESKSYEKYKRRDSSKESSSSDLDQRGKYRSENSSRKEGKYKDRDSTKSYKRDRRKNNSNSDSDSSADRRRRKEKKKHKHRQKYRSRSRSPYRRKKKSRHRRSSS